MSRESPLRSTPRSSEGLAELLLDRRQRDRQQAGVEDEQEDAGCGHTECHPRTTTASRIGLPRHQVDGGQSSTATARSSTRSQ